MNNDDFASEQLNKVQQRLAHAAHRAGRHAHEITLIGASKQQPLERIAAFIKAGLTHMGENYVQEGLDKQRQLPNADVPTWHFIGALQSNKTALVAQHFDWVHSIDRLKIARRLAQQRGDKTPLNGLIQLNLEQESSKAGVPENELERLLESLLPIPNITIRGFMLIPAPTTSTDQQRRVFARAKTLLDSLSKCLDTNLDTLSMGMSADLESAIMEGSTMIRVGTDLFGPRPQKQ